MTGKYCLALSDKKGQIKYVRVHMAGNFLGWKSMRKLDSIDECWIASASLIRLEISDLINNESHQFEWNWTGFKLKIIPLDKLQAEYNQWYPISE